MEDDRGRSLDPAEDARRAELIAQLSKRMDAHRAVRRRIDTADLWWFPCAWAALLWLLRPDSFLKAAAVVAGIALVGGIGAAVTFRRRSAAEDRRDRELTGLLDDVIALDDPRAVAVLGRLFREVVGALRQRVRPALLALLDRLHASDVAVLDAECMAELVRLLRCDDLDVLVADLHAVGQLTPAGAEAEVRRLHRYPPRRLVGDADLTTWRANRKRPPKSNLDRFLTAVEMCESFLAMARDAGQQRDTLLRAANGPQSSLLRPAGSAEPQIEFLVKPSEREEE